MLVTLPITLQLRSPANLPAALERRIDGQLLRQLGACSRAALSAAVAHAAVERGCPAAAVLAVAGAHLACEALAVGPWRRAGRLRPTWLGVAGATLASSTMLAVGQVVAGPLGMGCAGWWTRRQLDWVQQQWALPSSPSLPPASPALPACGRLAPADPVPVGGAPALAALPAASVWAGHAKTWLVMPPPPPRPAATASPPPSSTPPAAARPGLGWLAAAWGATVGWCRVGLSALVGGMCLLAGAVRSSWDRGGRAGHGSPQPPGVLALGTLVAEMGPQVQRRAPAAPTEVRAPGR